MNNARLRIAVLVVGTIVVAGLVWVVARQRPVSRTGESHVALVCGVPTSVFDKLPQPLGNDQAAQEVRRDPSMVGEQTPARWRVYENGNTRTYLAGQPPTLHVTTLTRKGARWRWSGGGGCQTFVEPPGAASAIWAIPRGDVDRGAPQFSVVATDRQCASGHSADERVGQARVVETARTVTVTFTASKPSDGFQTCPSHPAALRIVKLATALGDRVLLDGGIYPPQPPCVIGGPPTQPDYCNSVFYG